MDFSITKTSSYSKKGLDNENSVSVEIKSAQTALPADSAAEAVDQYTQYMKEKDASNKYRMIFTISPICSNVLFNRVTEVVSNEGDPEKAIFYGDDGPTSSGYSKTLIDYYNYKVLQDPPPLPFHGIIDHRPKLTRSHMIKDTGYSHPETGNVVYHCGYDIFDNHTLRRKEFGVINKLWQGDGEREGAYSFNAIGDFSRNFNGTVNQIVPPRIDTMTVGDKEMKYIVTGVTANQHEYLYDTVLPFARSIRENLTEEDGWLGFLNPCTLKVPNYVVENDDISVSLNKCMNNNKAGEFIDMYPDRSLYSFLPKYNKYLNRYEYNWDYCITYPYRNFYDNRLVQETYEGADMKVNDVEMTSYTINGIRANTLNDDIENVANTLFVYNPSTLQVVPKYAESDTLTLRTDVKHTFSNRYSATVWMIFEIGDEQNKITRIFKTPPINVISTRLNGGDDNYYITFNYSDFAYYISMLIDENIIWRRNLLEAKIQFRLSKTLDGLPCQYYFRVFKKIPNFARTNVYNDRYVSEEEIEANIDNKYNTDVQKMAFERTIYNENKVQIIYNDDIDISCLRDNLGRPLSEVYLTIIKKNTGYRHWYGLDNGGKINPQWSAGTENVEFSHCFGKVTSGIDAPSYVGNYNVHKLHNLSDECIGSLAQCSYIVPQSAKTLEESNDRGSDYEITTEGDTFFMEGSNHRYEFFGDIVEFYPTKLGETILEDVFFRFNTQQREYDFFDVHTSATNTIVTGEFANLRYNEIVSDDYDNVYFDDNAQTSFKVNEKTYNTISECDIQGKRTKTIHYPINICPEGYYYKAHYRIPVRKLSDTVQSGSHIKIYLDGNPTVYPLRPSLAKIVTRENYYLDATSKLCLYKKDDSHKREEAIVMNVSGDDYREVVIQTIGISANELVNYDIFKVNPIMPDDAYEYPDGTGRYVWRDVEKEINLTADDELFNSMFTNGAHYRHENITFMLHRQDPYGENQLMPTAEMGGYSRMTNLSIAGKYQNLSNKEYIPEEEGIKC